MHTQQISDYGHLFYDPTIYGYDDDFFKAVSGQVSGYNGKIRILKDGTIGAVVSSTTMFMFGELSYRVTIPTEPTAGDSRIIGFYSRALGNQNAAYLFISGTNVYTRTYGNGGVVEQNTITWDSSWTNTPITFKILWKIERVEFWIDDNKIAVHTTQVPRQKMMPMYISNTDSTANNPLDISWIEIRNTRKLYFAKPNHYTPGISVSSSVSSSPSTSVSSSPSLSASSSLSSSPSSSVSPSTSVSSSPSTSVSSSISLSPSLSASSSPSTSRSSSISSSPSSSVSSSPSASESPSTSVSSSPSTSVSSSASSSRSASVSSSVSSSPSSSGSPSPTPSSSVSSSASSSEST